MVKEIKCITLRETESVGGQKFLMLLQGVWSPVCTCLPSHSK